MTLLLWGAGCAVVQADSIKVTVVDPAGVPVPEVVVFIEQDGNGVQRGSPESAVMDQRNKQFVDPSPPIRVSRAAPHSRLAQ